MVDKLNTKLVIATIIPTLSFLFFFGWEYRQAHVVEFMKKAKHIDDAWGAGWRSASMTRGIKFGAGKRSLHIVVDFFFIFSNSPLYTREFLRAHLHI